MKKLWIARSSLPTFLNLDDWKTLEEKGADDDDDVDKDVLVHVLHPAQPTLSTFL